MANRISGELGGLVAKHKYRTLDAQGAKREGGWLLTDVPGSAGSDVLTGYVKTPKGTLAVSFSVYLQVNH